MKVLVVVPTYNERENIQELIKIIKEVRRKLREEDILLDMLVVDDNSPDGTAEVIKSSKEEFIHLIINENKKGLGKAYRKGFKWALENGYDVVISMDADLSHDPNDIPRFIKEIKNGEADIVVGSRYLNGIRILNWDLKRLILSVMGNKYAQIVTGMHITDLTGGFNAYKTSVLKEIKPEEIESEGYAFQIEMKFRAFAKGFKIKEIPIIFKERERGVSKLNQKIIWEALYRCLELRIKKMIGKL